MDMMSYRDQANTMDEKDSNYCVPVALGLVSGTPARQVSDSLISKNRRKFGAGVYPSDWKAELDDMGIGYTDVTVKYTQGRGITVKTLTGMVDPNRKFLVRVHAHLLAIVGGHVEDWTRGRKHKVKEIVEITENDVTVSSFTPKSRGKGRDTEALATLLSDVQSVINADVGGYGTWSINAKITGSWVKVFFDDTTLNSCLIGRNGDKFTIALQTDKNESRYWVGKWIEENLPRRESAESKSYSKRTVTGDELGQIITAMFGGET